MRSVPTSNDLQTLHMYIVDGISRNKSPEDIWGLYCESNITPFERNDVTMAYCMTGLTIKRMGTEDSQQKHMDTIKAYYKHTITIGVK